MTDFMVRMVTDYPWFGWLTAVLAVAGLAYVSLWVAGLSAFASDWIAYRRAVLGYKAAVRRRLEAAPCAVCELAEEGMDLPEYQHPDGDDDLDYCRHGVIRRTCTRCEDELFAEPHEEEVEAFLAAVKMLGLLNDDDQLPDGPPAEGVIVPRCGDPECDKYGWVHPPPCLILPTMPVPKYTGGPAMPPQDWSGHAASLEVLARGDDDKPLHPAIQASLETAGFRAHDTTEGLVDTSFTRAMARQVQARMRELER